MEEVLVDVVLVVTEEYPEVVVEYVVVEELPEVEEKLDLPKLLSARDEPLPEFAALVTAEEGTLPEEAVPIEEAAPPEEAIPPEEAVPTEEATPPEEAAPPEELASPELIPPEEPPGVETIALVPPVEAGITSLSPKPPEAEP